MTATAILLLAASTVLPNGAVMTPNGDLGRHQPVATDVSKLISRETDPNVAVTNGELWVRGERVPVGSGQSVDTNSVMGLVDSSFRGGTQEVNRVTGAFDGVAARVEAVESGTNAWNAAGADATNYTDAVAGDLRSYADGISAYTRTLNVRKRNRFDTSAGWTWSSSDAGCPPAVVGALNGAMNFPYPDVIEGTSNLSWGVEDVRTNGVFLARCVGPLTYPASADVREMTFRFSTNPVATAGFDFEATARRVDSIALRSHVDSATNGLASVPYVDSATNGIRRVDGAARPLPKYLHALDFDDTYPADAEWYYAQPQDYGHCSSVRDGGFLCRNYDWKFDDAAEFVVRVSAGPGRFASVGVANCGTNLTEEVVTGGKPSRYYKCLPGRVVDGINENGVACNVNVVGGDPQTSGWHNDTGDLNPLAAIRWILDHATNAQHAAEYIALHIAFPSGWTQNFHYMIADERETWFVEDGSAVPMMPGTWEPVMTNFHVPDAGGKEGPGSERYHYLLPNRTAITNVWYTNAYRRETTPPWVSDLAEVIDYTNDIFNAWAAHPKEYFRGKTNNGIPWWQTVHTSIYDITNRTLRIAVQETDDWYVFQVPSSGAKVDAYTKAEADAKLAEKANKNGDESEDFAASTLYADDFVPKHGESFLQVRDRVSSLETDKANMPIDPVPNNIAVFDGTGGLSDSGIPGFEVVTGRDERHPQSVSMMDGVEPYNPYMVYNAGDRVTKYVDAAMWVVIFECSENGVTGPFDDTKWTIVHPVSDLERDKADRSVDVGGGAGYTLDSGGLAVVFNLPGQADVTVTDNSGTPVVHRLSAKADRSMISATDPTFSNAVNSAADFTPANTQLVATVQSVNAGHMFRYHMASPFSCNFTLFMANGDVVAAEPDRTYLGVVSIAYAGKEMIECREPYTGSPLYYLVDGYLYPGSPDRLGPGWDSILTRPSFSGTLVRPVFMYCVED